MASPKRQKISTLSLNEKIIITNVFKYIKNDETLNLSVDDSVQKCSLMTGVGKTSIYRILKEEKTGGATAPKPKPGKAKLEVTEHVKISLRRIVHGFFIEKKIPTLDLILEAVKNDPQLPTMGRTKLWSVLKSINFRYEKFQRKSLVIERGEIVQWRRDYLRKIRHERSQGKRIYYLDETWINEGYTVNKFWQDKNVLSSRQAFMEGWSTGLRPPSGKGRRIIITHIGSSDGFVNGGLLTFESKKTGDYHEDMNSDVFEEWFTQMIDLIPLGSIIVMDNASYHSKKVGRVPTMGWLKRDIQSWLTERNILFEDDHVKRELIELVRNEVLLNKEKYNKYVIDEIAKTRGITILRLPPYHCELNPIELVWAQVKSEVAKNNVTYKLADIKNLFAKAISNVTPENWRKCVEHVIKQEDRMWTLDITMDQMVEPLVISLGSPDAMSDFSSDMSMSDMEDV